MRNGNESYGWEGVNGKQLSKKRCIKADNLSLIPGPLLWKGENSLISTCALWYMHPLPDKQRNKEANE